MCSLYSAGCGVLWPPPGSTQIWPFIRHRIIFSDVTLFICFLGNGCVSGSLGSLLPQQQHPFANTLYFLELMVTGDLLGQRICKFLNYQTECELWSSVFKWHLEVKMSLWEIGKTSIFILDVDVNYTGHGLFVLPSIKPLRTLEMGFSVNNTLLISGPWITAS